MNFSKESEKDILGIDNFMYMGDNTFIVDVSHRSEIKSLTSSSSSETDQKLVRKNR